VKPFTEYDVKLLKGTDFNTAALDGIMVVGDKRQRIKSKFSNEEFHSCQRSEVRLAFLHNPSIYDMSMASIPVQSMRRK
jgi:hypothetical protein